MCFYDDSCDFWKLPAVLHIKNEIIKRRFLKKNRQLKKWILFFLFNKSFTFKALELKFKRDEKFFINIAYWFCYFIV